MTWDTIVWIFATASCVVFIIWRWRLRSSIDLDNAEWSQLKPGPFLYSTLILCIIASIFFSYYLYLGSSRPNPEQEMLYGKAVTAFFVAGSVVVLWMGWGRKIWWRDDELRVRSFLGSESTYRLSEVAAVTRSDLKEQYTLLFRNGSKVRFATSLRGAETLASLAEAAVRSPSSAPDPS